MAAAHPNNNKLQSNVGLSLGKLAEALRAAATRGALAADRESLEIARTLADKDPGNKQFRTDVVLALWRLAAVGDNPRERLTEALKLLKNLKLAAMLSPAQEEWMAKSRTIFPNSVTRQARHRPDAQMVGKPVEPGLRLFKLRGQLNQRSFLAIASAKMHPDRKAVAGPMQWYAHRRRAGCVV